MATEKNTELCWKRLRKRRMRSRCDISARRNWRVERKGDGTAVTQADRAVEEMARAKVAASGLPLDVLGEEMGGGDANLRALRAGANDHRSH